MKVVLGALELDGVAPGAADLVGLVVDEVVDDVDAVVGEQPPAEPAGWRPAGGVVVVGAGVTTALDPVGTVVMVVVVEGPLTTPVDDMGTVVVVGEAAVVEVVVVAGTVVVVATEAPPVLGGQSAEGLAPGDVDPLGDGEPPGGPPEDAGPDPDGLEPDGNPVPADPGEG